MKTKLLVLGALFASLCASVQGQTPTPVLHLSFDNVDATGTNVINDGSGAAMDGALYGSATIVPGGKFGNCLQVTGVNANDASCRIASAVVPLNVTAGSAWTVAVWIKSSTKGGTWAYQGDGGWAANNTTLAMVVNNGTTGVNGPAAGGVRYGQGWMQGTAVVDNGQWHHIVFTFDGTNNLQYVDGVLDPWVANGWAVGTGDNGAGAQFWIGGSGDTGDGDVNLNGLIDEAYVFDVALSASDIQKLYDNNSLTITPVPVAVTVSPDRGLRGTVVTITATATPAAGTATNAVADLSAFGLTNALQLVQSSPNVFTNSFTVPTTNSAPIGHDNVKVTVIDTEPLVGSGATNFFVLAVPPTNATVVTQLTSQSAYAYDEVSFHFAATNDAPNSTNNAFFPMTYAWYTNGVLVSTNPMGPYYTFLTTPDQNNLPVQCIARINDDTNYYSSLSVTSALVTLTVNSGTPVFTNGLKREYFTDAYRSDVEIGNVSPGVVSLVSSADLLNFNNNISFVERISGYFIPPADGAYVFFLSSDNDSDLFLSTDSSIANKQLIAQEAGWSDPYRWLTAGGAGSVTSQKRSDQWTNSIGEMPYTNGFSLLAGHRYYIEAVHRNDAGGGEGLAITYQTTNEIADPNWSVNFTNGAPSLLNATNNNIAAITWAGTSLAWAADLTPTAVRVSEGATTNFTCLATNDAEMVPNYQWYLNDAPLPGATSTNLILSTIPFSYNRANLYVVASNEEGGLVITSRVATLTVVQAVHEAGFIKDERWNGKVVSDIVNNTVSLTPDFQMAITEWGVGIDNNGGHDNFARRVSGYFIPPTTANYVFYVTSDDDSILFLSTDETAANKREVCQQDQWNTSAPWGWQTYPSWVNWYNPSLNSCSSTYNNNAFASGIPLIAGQRYYIEQDMHQGGGGANLGATFTYFGDGVPTTGTPTELKGTNIQMSVNRCYYVAFTKQPANATSVAGMSVAFSADGTTDSQVTIGGPTGYEEDYASNYLTYQWFTNDVAVPGANFKKFLLGPLTSDYAGMRVMCKARALGYTDDTLTNRLWTNSLTAILTAVTPRTPSLLGHWLSTASLADSANYVAPGMYDGVAVTNGSYSFTNDVPPGATAGAQSLHLAGAGIVISNTASSEAGYTDDTFDGNIQNQFTIAFWAKGAPNSWDPWVSKNGENSGWQMRKLGWSGDTLETFTMRGSGGDADPYPSLASDASNWHYYAGTFDTTTGNRTLYLDGQLVNQQTSQTPYTLPASSHLVIGGRDNGGLGNYFTGNLYDVRIYNYALTQSEVAILGNSKPTFTSEVTTDGSGNQQLVITYPFGTLLEATNLMGPWTTNSAVSPATITIDPTEPQLFFKLSNP